MALVAVDPKTNARMKIKVVAGSTVITDATVTANIVSPEGHLIVSNVSCPYSSTYTAYLLEILPAWSTGVSGEELPGVYLVQVAVDRFGKKRAKVLKYLVTFKTK